VTTLTTGGALSSLLSSGKKISSAEVPVRLPTLRWAHVAVSQSQPRMKWPKTAIYVDGRLVHETDALPCPPTPFGRASLGAG
jgi:hypothetical protein